MTAERVSCSAWLGVFAWNSPKMWRKRSGEVALAGEDRTARDRKVESRSRMALRRTKVPHPVEARGRREDQTVAAAAAWPNREGMTPRSECASRKRRGRQASRESLERLSNASFSGEASKNA